MNFFYCLSILSPLYNGFGRLMSFLYEWLQNYGLVIIFVNVAIKILLLPINMSMQRGMARRLFLQDDIMEIKRVYANDPQKVQEAQMELMQRAGISMTSGCLPQLAQFLILIAIWRPIQQPLFYIAGVNAENLQNIAGLLVDKGLATEQIIQQISRSDVNILALLREHGNVLAEAIDNGWIRLNQVLDLNFLGMDLGLTPSFNPAQIFGAETRASYLPLIILVLVMLATMIISLAITRKAQEQDTQSKEEKERIKRNPAKQEQAQDQNNCMMKGMNYFMPLMMLWFAFSAPAAMALFWLTSNLVAIVQSLLSYNYYTKPAMEMVEARRAEKRIPGRRKK